MNPVKPVSPEIPTIYSPENLRIIHSLRYDWTGWLKDRQTSFPETLPTAIDTCKPLWEADGLELDTWQSRNHRLQCLFTAWPQVSPAKCAARVKGRLQHALRKGGTPVAFSGTIGFRSLGDNTREIVKQYVERQAVKSDYVDPRFKIWLEQFNRGGEGVALAEPAVTGHGRYWYNLHLVLVVQDRRFPMTRHETFGTVRDHCFRIANDNGYQAAEVSVMPDHVHLALRGSIEHSPERIALAYLNGLSRALGSNRCWSEECYVGTFSEYRVSQI